MSVYIPGMEMPKNCGSCELVKSFTIDSELILYCPINGEVYCKERKGCPLVPVPSHGRLIDADALINHLEFTTKHCTIEGHTAQRYREMIVELSIAPTIIEADPEEEGKK